ncbi:MAG: NAD(P)-dependent oxidoreductase, partial [Pseudomonadota bacterium]
MARHLLLIGGATDRMMERMRADYEITRLVDQGDLSAFLDARGADFEAIMTNGHDGVPKAVMDGLPNLKIIACYGVGYDAIDAEAAARRGIVVTHTPDVLNDEVANTAILLMLALYRNLLHEDSYVRDGRWLADGNAPLTHSPEHRKVGLLGMGRIGMRIAEKLQAFQADVSYHSRSPKDVPYGYVGDLVALAEQVEVLICITPGGPTTAKL